jgi:hypothetical protein
VAGFDFKGGLIRGGNDEFLWDAYFRYSIGGSLGAGAVLEARAGSAVIEITVTGGGDALLESPGAAVLEILSAAVGTGVLDGVGLADLEFIADAVEGSAQTGEAVMEFTVTGVGAYSRTRIRVITNQKNAKRGVTAVGSRASGTSFRTPRSHTEVTNG